MNNSRRSFLTAIASAAALASVALLTADAQQSKPTPPPHPDPNQNPGRDAYQQDQQQNKPPGAVPETPRLTPEGRKAILSDDQKQIRKDVDELFGLAQDLKSQAEKMDSTAILSFQFVQKTEEIERLARKIRILARG